MSPMDIFSWLMPEEDSPESLRRWRQKVPFGMTLLFLMAIALPFWMNLNYLTAAESQEITQGLEKSVKEISDSVKELTESDQGRQERERQREIREVRQAILDTQIRVCMTEPGELRQSLAVSVGELRSQFMALTGTEFPPAPCNDLIGR